MQLPAQPNRSLIDGLAVLQAVVGRVVPAGCRELARELGLETTRVNRLLKTLAHLGLTQQSLDRRYGVGPGIHVLAAQAMVGSRLLRHALPVLEELRRYRCVVALGVLWRHKVCYLYHASAQTPSGETLGHAGLYRVDQSGIGCALLAQESDEQVWARLADTFTADSLEALLEKIRGFRSLGHARVEQPESKIGIGVALAPHTGAAIGLSGCFPVSMEAELVTSLREAAGEINRRESPS